MKCPFPSRTCPVSGASSTPSSPPRDGDFGELLRILDPDVVLRADAGATLPGGMRVIRGATAVAGQADTFRRMVGLCTIHPAVVNGTAGLVNTLDGAPFSIMGFTVVGDRLAAIDILADRDRLAHLDLSAVLDRDGVGSET